MTAIDSEDEWDLLVSVTRSRQVCLDSDEESSDMGSGDGARAMDFFANPANDAAPVAPDPTSAPAPAPAPAPAVKVPPRPQPSFTYMKPLPKRDRGPACL